MKKSLIPRPIRLGRKKTKEESFSVEQEIRRLGVLMEHTDDNVRLVAEQYDDIAKTLDNHTEMIGVLVVDMQIVKTTLDEHTRILDEHTRILDEHTRILDEHTRILGNHTEAIGDLTVDMQIVKIDVEFIKGSLKKKIDVEEFSALERRVALLEKRS